MHTGCRRFLPRRLSGESISRRASVMPLYDWQQPDPTYAAHIKSSDGSCGRNPGSWATFISCAWHGKLVYLHPGTCLKFIHELFNPCFILFCHSGWNETKTVAGSGCAYRSDSQCQIHLTDWAAKLLSWRNKMFRLLVCYFSTDNRPWFWHSANFRLCLGKISPSVQKYPNQLSFYMLNIEKLGAGS